MFNTQVETTEVQETRVFGFTVAHELTEAEIDLIGGGVQASPSRYSYTGCSCTVDDCYMIP
jgi:hypothetical protein